MSEKARCGKTTVYLLSRMEVLTVAMGLMKKREQLIDLKEAATLSGLAPKTWSNGGGGTNVVPRMRFGRSVRVRLTDVERFIEARLSEALRDSNRKVGRDE